MAILTQILLHSIILLIFCGVHVCCQCLEGEESLLLSLKSSLTVDTSESYSRKLGTWNQSLDCCYWKGVACSKDGRVVGLDLSIEGISDGLNDSSSLFGLGNLKTLNLAYNEFVGSAQIPSRLDELANLTYLNLSSAGFSGQIPTGISRLRNLVVLDVSGNRLTLENSSLRRLVQNLSELQELLLDGVNISTSISGEEWGQALSSFLPKLRVLSLADCNLRGPIHSSLSKLASLTYVDLGGNKISSPIPRFFANFNNLTTLSIGDADLNGVFPEEVFQIPALQSITLSENNIQGSLPEFPRNGGSLESLDLRLTNFSGRLPDSIGALRNLSYLDLSYSSFSGSIPKSLSNLTQLTYLDLSGNMLSGSIPSFSNLSRLSYVHLPDNSLSGSISSFSSLTQLDSLDLSNNAFSGSIPSFSASKNIEKLFLSGNNLSGSILSTHWESLSLLSDLRLQNNSLTGTIPWSLFSHPSLSELHLSHNLFTDIGMSDDGFTNQSSSSVLAWLDLSSNEISGKLPNNLLRKLEHLAILNLSYNSLEDLGTHAFSLDLISVDISHNRLQGDLPIFPPRVEYLDYSMNNFNSAIPDSVGTNLSDVISFSLAGNNLQGSIPESICNASSYLFELLDLSNNSLSGSVPQCLIMLTSSKLGVLNLRMNNLSGIISDAFPANCSLRTLNLNGNHLSGHIPESLANCRYLEVLDLGNNQFSGTFPCRLQQIYNLSVLILRSNKFRGEIGCLDTNDSWPMLQIVDVAANSFSGSLRPSSFGSWKAMMLQNVQSQSKAQPIGYEGHSGYYRYSVTVVAKGNEMRLEKILTIFTSIDFSSNHFEGHIPDSIGDLRSLWILNFSGNGFTGQIPNSLGRLAQLESLDLSSNKLTGKIPDQLSGLTFLSFLNLSHNRLQGLIPKGTQFSTFSAASYADNEALCGAPLSIKCNNDDNVAPSSHENEAGTSDTKWMLIAAEIGFTVGLGFVIGPLVFWRRWRIWYYERVDRLLLLIFFRKDMQRQPNHRRRRPGN